MNRDERQEAFREAEASLLLEGLDPRKMPIYRAVKAKLIDGTMSVAEAKAAIADHYRQRASKA